MNPFTVSHLSPMLSSPSLPPPPLSTAGASSSAFIPRLDIWLGRSASRVWSLKIKTRGGGAESSSVVSTTTKLGRRALLTSDMGAEEEVGSSRPLLQVQSGEELLSYIRRKVESGKLSPDVGHKLEELYYNYQNAILQSGNPNAHEVICANMAVAFDRMLLDAEDPFVFPPLHKAIREPFDYYKFGQNYIRPLVDFRNSYVGNIHLFQEMEQKLEQGHNIILMSNHQTEADPAVIALLLERDCPRIAENIFFIAGDRVVTDVLCKPFSMGRNLICVYSKKHMYDEPELVEMKRRANTRSLKEMALLLRGGSQIIWIAPSGGRDRPDPITGEWHPAPFDASSTDNMRRLAEHCHTPAHIYPLTLLCYEIMPPPRQVEKQIGERRKISFHGVGLSVGPEMNFQQVTSHCKEIEERGILEYLFEKACDSSFFVGYEGKEVFSQALYESVTGQYNALKSAIYGNKGLGASSDSISLSQPWQP